MTLAYTCKKRLASRLLDRTRVINPVPRDKNVDRIGFIRKDTSASDTLTKNVRIHVLAVGVVNLDILCGLRGHDVAASYTAPTVTLTTADVAGELPASADIVCLLVRAIGKRVRINSMELYRGIEMLSF